MVVIRRMPEAPSGWPRAMAPPRGFSRSGSAPSSFCQASGTEDRKSTRLNSSHLVISYAVFCLKKKSNHLVNLLEAAGISWKAYQEDEGPGAFDGTDCPFTQEGRFYAGNHNPFVYFDAVTGTMN